MPTRREKARGASEAEVARNRDRELVERERMASHGKPKRSHLSRLMD